MIKEIWQDAHNRASFFKSEKNTPQFWDAASDASGIFPGVEGEFTRIINSLLSALKKEGQLSSLLDVGCGNGAYLPFISEPLKSVVCLDYSKEMIRSAKNRLGETGKYSFICRDFLDYNPGECFDVCLAFLNPAIYSPEGFLHLLSLAKYGVILLNQVGDYEAAKEEPIYRGCHLSAYPVGYAKELGYAVVTRPYSHKVTLAGGEEREIPFEFTLVIK